MLPVGRDDETPPDIIAALQFRITVSASEVRGGLELQRWRFVRCASGARRAGHVLIRKRSGRAGGRAARNLVALDTAGQEPEAEQQDSENTMLGFHEIFLD